MVRRRWWDHRQAYSPRLWPLVPVIWLVAVAVAWLFDAWAWGWLIGIALGVAIPWFRWRVWRRRHPVLSPHERLDVWRRNAHLN